MSDGPFFPDDDKKDDDEAKSEVPEGEAGEEGAEAAELEAEGEEASAEPFILPDDDFGLPGVDPSERSFFDDDPDDAGGLPWKPVAAIVAGLVIGGAVWFMISGESDDRPPRTIAAPKDPVKERPEDPGGMDIPHQDTLVYNEVAGDAEPQTETLGPKAEEPLEMPVDASVDAGEPAEEPAEEPVAPLPAYGADEPPADEKIADAPKTRGSDWEGSYLVQLGAYSTVELAKSSWQGVYNANKDILSNPDANVLPKQSASGKEVFALRAGPYSNRGDARSVCKLLKTREVDCFVVSP